MSGSNFWPAGVADPQSVCGACANSFSTCYRLLAYRLLDFYLKSRSGGVERQRPSRPCKSRNKPTGSLRNNKRHSVMQLLGAKNDTVEPNRAEPWSAFSEGPSPAALPQWCHFTWAAGWGSGPHTTCRVAAPHQPANIHESRRPKPVDFGRHVHL